MNELRIIGRDSDVAQDSGKEETQKPEDVRDLLARPTEAQFYEAVRAMVVCHPRLFKDFPLDVLERWSSVAVIMKKVLLSTYRAISEFPKPTQYYENRFMELGELFRDARQFGCALTAYERVRDFAPKNQKSRIKYDSVVKSGDIYLENGRFSEAISCYEIAKLYNKNAVESDPSFRKNLARSYCELAYETIRNAKKKADLKMVEFYFKRALQNVENYTDALLGLRLIHDHIKEKAGGGFSLLHDAEMLKLEKEVLVKPPLSPTAWHGSDAIMRSDSLAMSLKIGDKPQDRSVIDDFAQKVRSSAAPKSNVN